MVQRSTRFALARVYSDFFVIQVSAYKRVVEIAPRCESARAIATMSSSSLVAIREPYLCMFTAAGTDRVVSNEECSFNDPNRVRQSYSYTTRISGTSNHFSSEL